ncbi:MAG: mechanosensitive ion channel [Candidatus Marinimicrobia bacterium]|nr:mechanosensitive ion channel [Candidatus Neomarinimicrobiota bacterium]
MDNILSFFKITNEFNNWIYIFLGIILSYISYFISKKILSLFITKIVNRSKNNWDDILLSVGVLDRITLLIPLIIFHSFLPYLPGNIEIYSRVFTGLSILIIILTIGALLTGVNLIYKTLLISEKHPIKSYIQILKLILYIIGGLTITAILMGKSPMVLVSGLGAMTAILLLVFRDTILSFVASLQITSNDLLKVGDWIEAPSFGADGDVIDIALHTVKIQNWDKTFTVIPTHKLIDNSFKNWRGMSQSGGRRIKRSINIDMTSVRFCSKDEIINFNHFDVLKDYVNHKNNELKSHNNNLKSNLDILVNGRRMTNLGTFRAYIESYLKSHAKIHENMTLLVRQLKPGNIGIPIEIYCFTNDTNWNNYEAIQADIFDHLLAVIPEFGLRVYQNPSSNDFKKLGN